VALFNRCKYEENVNPRYNTDDINRQFDENHDFDSEESMITSPSKERMLLAI
jgi:succinylglutamate desuccinylase